MVVGVSLVPTFKAYAKSIRPWPLFHLFNLRAAREVILFRGIERPGAALYARPAWGLGIDIGVDEPANHALVLSVMLCSLRLEELDTLLAQSQGYFHVFFTKCQFGRRREEVRNHLNLAKGFIGVFDF